MNVFRLIAATMAMCPCKSDETQYRYVRRVLLTAAEAVHTAELFLQCGEDRVGSDPHIARILVEYEKLTRMAHADR